VIEERPVGLVVGTVEVVERELDAVEGVLAERLVRAAEHEQRADVDRLVRPDLDAPELDRRAVDLAARGVGGVAVGRAGVVVVGTSRSDERQNGDQRQQAHVAMPLLHGAPFHVMPPSETGS
jgi:hypothetical protein